MRLSLSKNELFVFNKFMRKYKASLQNLKIGQLVSNDEVLKALGYLGYVDEHINQHSQQLSHTISDCSVTRGSLFQFLRIISDVRRFPTTQFIREVRPLANDFKKQINQPLVVVRLGQFSQNGQWICNAEEQSEIKKMFGFMNLKRISRQNIEAQSKENVQFPQQQTFKPQILDKSRQMAEKRLKKLSLSKTSKVQERLLLNKSLQKSRLQVQMNKSMQKQMKQCYFKPKINTPKRQIMSYSLCKYVESMNTSFENKENDRTLTNITSHQTSSQNISKSKGNFVGDKLLNKGKQYQNNLQKLKDQYKQLNDFFQMKQCTFQPKLNQKVYSNHMTNNQVGSKIKGLKVRNAQKSVQRVKQARKKRQFQNQVKQRGYPQNLAWTKFMNTYKSQFSYENKTPILCIDLKIMDTTRNIKVYEGQSVEEISQRICVENSVPHEFWNKVQSLLKVSIEQCNEVKIYQDKIYLNR